MKWELGKVFVLRHAGFPFDWVERLGVTPALLDDVRRWLAAGSPITEQPALEAAYAMEHAALRERLHALSAEPRMQEAVFLSSPDMYECVWRSYADQPLRAENANVRRVERQVYAYVQRLTSKNETTSFFGPMGYGSIHGDDDSIEIVPATLPVTRRTHLAYWAVEALGQAMAREPELWSQLPIRRNPLFFVDEQASVARCDSLEREEPLTADELRFVSAIKDSCYAEDVARILGLARPQVEATAMSLFMKGVLVRRFWFRSDVSACHALLVAELSGLAECEAKTRWTANLEKLDELRARFETAALAGRRELLPCMEALFGELTGVPARRAGGRLYTDRLLLNEEASSPFELRIGERAAARLAETLSPLLSMSAAYGEAVQQGCRAALHAAMPDAGPQSLTSYAVKARDVVAAPPAMATPVNVNADCTVPQQVSPDAWGAPTKEPRFSLPDVCLGRRADGAFHAVLARMHHHLLTPGWLFQFHPDAKQAASVASTWLSAQTHTPRLVELASGRHNKGYYTFPGPRVAHASAEMAPRSHRTLCAADLTVTMEADGPVLRAPDGAELRLYLPLADLTTHPPFAALSSPLSLQAPLGRESPCTPRFDVGDATYQRRRWDVSITTLQAKTSFARFVAMHREVARLGLPRFVFARVPAERKPFLVDTQSPFAVELLRHHLRDDPRVTFEEMLPSPDLLWLKDAAGQRYTFELRMQASRSNKPG